MSALATSGMPPVVGSVVEILGWTLLHFLWQGSLVAGVCAVVLAGLRRSPASTRYLVCCAAMAAMVVAPVATAILVARVAAAPLAPAASSLAGTDGWMAARSLEIAPVLPALTAAWLVGVLVLQTRLVRSFTRAQHLRRSGARSAPARWEQAAGELCRQMGIRTAVRVLESSEAAVPMLIGWLRPVILLPTVALTGLTPLQVRAVLAHELTHVRRHDYVVNLAQAVVETLLFYHPAVWWLSGRLRAEREYCCDDVAVSVCGDALGYARALSALDALRDDGPQPALASTGGSLMDRIRRLAGVRGRPARRPGAWLTPIVIAGALTVAGVAAALGAVVERIDDGAAAGAPAGALDHVDLLGIVREHDPALADFVAVLDEAGLDHDLLLMVLEEIGPDAAVLESIARARHREALVERQLHAVHEAVAERLAAGGMTIEEAETHLDLARRELHERLRADDAARAERHEAARALKRDYHAMERELAEELAAGRLTQRERAERLERAQVALEARLDERHPRPGDALTKARLRELHERLEAAPKAGPMTEAEALATRLHALEAYAARLHAELAERLAAEGGADEAAAEEARARFDAVRRELDVARRKVHEALRGAHERLMTEHGLSPEAFEAWRRAAAAGDATAAAKLKAAHELLAQAVASGRMAGAEALELYHEALRAHGERHRPAASGSEEAEAIHANLEAVLRKIEHAEAAGRITAEEAARKREALHRAIEKGHGSGHGPSPQPRQELHHRLQEMLHRGAATTEPEAPREE